MVKLQQDVLRGFWVMEKKIEDLIVDIVKAYVEKSDIKTRWKNPLVAFAERRI